MYAFVVLDSGDLLLYRYTSPFSSSLAGHYLHQYLPGSVLSQVYFLVVSVTATPLSFVLPKARQQCLSQPVPNGL